MNPTNPPLPRTGLSRADLLRVLAVSHRERLALEDDGDLWFGYVRRKETPVVHEMEVTVPLRVSMDVAEEATPASTGYRLPLRMPEIPMIVSREARAAPEPSDAQPDNAQPLSLEALKPTSPRRVGHEDLIPPARLLPALRRWLGSVRTGRLDLHRLSIQLASASPPRRLPHLKLRRWHPGLVVVLDFCDRLWPYRQDMHRLARSLRRNCGKGGVSLRIVNHGPAGGWTDWREEQTAVVPPRPQPWHMPPAGTPVLLVSDMGLLLGGESATTGQWARFVAELWRAGCRPLALAPLGSAQLDETVGSRLPILRWSPDSRVHPERARGRGDPQPEGVADLLALMAVLRRVDPPLLRALRRLLPVDSHNAGLEGAVWSHPDIEAGTAAALRRGEQIDTHLDRFQRNLAGRHSQLATLRRLHHAHLSPALHWEETLAFASHAEPTAIADRISRDEIDLAVQCLQQLAAALAQPGAATGDKALRDVAKAIEARADAAMAKHYAGVLMPLVAERIRHEQKAGIAPEVPEWADTAELAARLREGGGEPVEAWLVRDAVQGCIVLQTQPPGARQSAMGKSVWLEPGGFRVRLPNGSSRWLVPTQLPVKLGDLSGGSGFELITGRDHVMAASVGRPRGVDGWLCDRAGIHISPPSIDPLSPAVWSEPILHTAFVPGLDGKAGAWRLMGLGPLNAGNAGKFGSQVQTNFDDYGLYADIRFSSDYGSAAQRFRYIDPGSFLMGSLEEETQGLARSEDEKPWFEAEHPRHSVTLTGGYWLADTPCKQGLWQAVMGANPSRFQSPDRPVEQVSWNDVQGLLRELEGLLPGVKADLPTEAEWEYACRAGTDTALYTGSVEILGQCNAPALDGIAWYAGNSGVGFEGANGYDSSGWPEKQYPDSPSGTHRVGRKRPNAWGLYDMLGNVWEWCGDGFRDYTTESLVNPVGEVTEERPHRAVRGGSWSGSAGWVRSAFRGRNEPDLADLNLGFRLCLRSIEPGQDRASGTPGLVPGGRSVFPRDEGKPKGAERRPSWIERLIPGRKKKG